jgi:hypothetical protein
MPENLKKKKNVVNTLSIRVSIFPATFHSKTEGVKVIKITRFEVIQIQK